jgi:glycerol-3-phosphate cytidylyltransferase
MTTQIETTQNETTQIETQIETTQNETTQIETQIETNLYESIFKNINEIYYLETYGFNLDICVYRKLTHLHAQLCFKILDETKLDYYVFAGTSVGYIRNKENIPWVDDYDIIIFEDNIEYFENIIINKLEKYGFICYKFEENGGYKIISGNDWKIFSCDVFNTKVENGIIKNLNRWGLYGYKNIPIDYVKPKQYLTIDGDLTLPFFNNIKDDIDKEYGDVINTCKVHMNHNNVLTINENYTIVYKVFNKIKNLIINNMKKRFENHKYETNLTLTNETNLGLISKNKYDKHITVLEYIKNKNVKVLYLMDENYLIYCPDIKLYFPNIIINFYMTNEILNKHLILLNYIDNIYCSTQNLIDSFNNYTLLFHYYEQLKTNSQFSKPNIELISVITFGTFDLFHHGHFNILQNCLNFGKMLIVGISTDELNIKKCKISINNLQKRKTDVLNTKFTEIIFDEEDLSLKNSYVKKYNCNLLIMGDDWKDKFDFCDCACVYLPRTPNISTTLLKSQLK